MLIVLIKTSIILIICLCALYLFRFNSPNLRHKILAFGFLVSLLFPLLSYTPLSFNLNKAGSVFSGVINSEIISPTQKFYQSPNIADNHLDLSSQKKMKNEKEAPKSDIFFKIFVSYLFLFVWLLGLIIQVFRYIKQIFELKRIIKHSQVFHKPYLLKSLKGKTINYNISNLINVPFLFVSIKSIEIVMPTHVLQWAVKDIQNIAKHEICHYRRKDHWLLYLSSVASIVYWFHPLMKYLYTQHKYLIELACDKKLVSEGINASSYANTLLILPKNDKELSLVPFMSCKQSLLKQRIKAIVNDDYHKLKLSQLSFLFLVVTGISLSGCVNNNDLPKIKDFVEFVSYDLPSLRSGKLGNQSIQIATFYDGLDNQNTFVELEFKSKNNNNKAWLKLGPLKKFNHQIQTWQYKTTKGELTGRYKVTNSISDGSVDGVALGIVYVDANINTVIHKSSGPLEQGVSNILCAWPLDISNNKFIELTPQLTKENHGSIKRLLCGAQLLKHGLYSLN